MHKHMYTHVCILHHLLLPFLLLLHRCPSPPPPTLTSCRSRHPHLHPPPYTQSNAATASSSAFPGLRRYVGPGLLRLSELHRARAWQSGNHCIRSVHKSHKIRFAMDHNCQNRNIRSGTVACDKRIKGAWTLAAVDLVNWRWRALADQKKNRDFWYSCMVWLQRGVDRLALGLRMEKGHLRTQIHSAASTLFVRCDYGMLRLGRQFALWRLLQSRTHTTPQGCMVRPEHHIYSEKSLLSQEYQGTRNFQRRPQTVTSCLLNRANRNP